ncbi:MAG: response regulator [Desulfobacterales bacterium]|nr:response regulator [Desulfobacterales bacterium]
MKNVLVVDNSPVLLQLMTKFLEKEGLRVETAGDGLNALDVLASFTPDIMFVDLVMPNIDGKMLCRILRSNEAYKDIYLVILSAISAEEWIDIREIGADACIAKGPFTDMAIHVRSVLKNPVEIRAKCMAGEVLGVDQVFPRGITQELLSVKRHFEAILEQMAEGIIEINLENRIIYANPAALYMIGQPEGTLLGMKFPRLFDGGDRERVRTLLQKDSDSLKHITEDAPLTLNRSLIALQIKNLGEKEKTSTVILQDVTERKKAEEELKRHRTRLEDLVKERTKALSENEERYRLLFKNAPAGIFELDLEDSKLIRVNDVMCRYTGYQENELLNLSLDALMDPKAKALWEKQAKEAAAGEVSPDPLELPIRGKEDRQFQALVTSGFHLVNGAPAKATVVIHDLTEIKKAEEEKKRLETQLHRAQKLEALGTLAAGIAHDFNNLLMSILGNTSLVLMDIDPNHPHYENLKNIEKSVKSGEALTRRALGLVRPGNYQTMPTNINELIQSSSKMFGRTKKEIRIFSKYQKDVWNVNVDPNQIDQVLLNLFVNAWQAMPGGGDLYIETRNVALGPNFVRPYGVSPGNYVQISVSDSGTGMEKETVEKIFDPFFTTKEAGQGTGLGMAISYGIIKDHHAVIDVHSVSGEGSTFDIYLPASPAAAGIETEASFPPARGEETILLVDDEQMILDVGKRLLEKIGYRVVTAESGEAAVDIYQMRRAEIDMVILDMIMPGLGGSDTFDRLQGVDPTVPVLLASGYSERGKAEEIVERGCRGFLQKPFTLEALALKIREVLDSEAPENIGGR